MLNTALNEVVTPSRGKLSLRTRFAMGILKVIRRYMTEGKEEEVKRKQGSQIREKTSKGNTNNLLERWRHKFTNDGRGEVMGLCVADNIVPSPGCMYTMNNGKILGKTMVDSDPELEVLQPGSSSNPI